MPIFYRGEQGPPDLRREMTLAGFDMASIASDCAEIGCTLEAYMEGLVTRPGGVCGLLSRRGDARSKQSLARLGAHRAHSNAESRTGK